MKILLICASLTLVSCGAQAVSPYVCPSSEEKPKCETTQKESTKENQATSLEKVTSIEEPDLDLTRPTDLRLMNKIENAGDLSK